MYGLRKPFSVGTYSEIEFWVFDLKSALVLSQLVGYATSKFIGIKFNSELSASRRLWTLFFLIAWAEAALLLFAVLPPGGKVFAVFLNGLPLGVVWGVVFSFLEGRRSSEILGAGLSCSYIVASGFVKSVGKGFLESGVSESWMPALTGAVFLPIFLIASVGLSMLPAPTALDVAERTKRVPMGKRQRRAFLREYWLGLSLLVVVYLFLTAYRDFRDNYSAEIWKELGMGSSATIFTKTEVPIAISVMILLSLLYLIRDNRKGLSAAYALMAVGSVLIGLCTLLFDLGLLSPTHWMTGVGLGLYMGYVPYGCVLFDRTIAALHVAATAVFLIYISDAVAYGGSILAVLYKEFGQPSATWLDFFRGFSYLTSVLTTICLLLSWRYFLRRANADSATENSS
ncbi:MAG: hypothetical protein JKY56_03005 [Kofleriaceae bacterium]|nr:hypothetical protein [Kofleriaceae bacterium]